MANREKGENERKEKRRERRKPRNTTIVVSIQPISVERASIHRGSEPARVRMRVQRGIARGKSEREREQEKGTKPLRKREKSGKELADISGREGRKRRENKRVKINQGGKEKGEKGTRRAKTDSAYRGGSRQKSNKKPGTKKGG